MVYLETNTDHSVIFETASKYCISDSFVDYDGMFLCNIALYSIRPCFYHQSHPQLGVVFALALSLHSFWSYLHWSPEAYWAPTNLGSSSFSVLYFCLFILFMGFSRQEYWSGLPFPFPWDHILSELSTMTRPSWVALQGMAHSFIELDKTVVQGIRLVSFLWLWFSVCLPSDGEGKLPDGIDWLRGILGLVLMGRGMLNKSLIQFSVDGWSCVPSLFTWGQTMVEVMKIMVTSLKRCMYCYSQWPPILQQATTTLCWRLPDNHIPIKRIIYHKLCEI